MVDSKLGLYPGRACTQDTPRSRVDSLSTMVRACEAAARLAILFAVMFPP